MAREGANEVPEKCVHLAASFARKFWGLSAWMIELIALVSFLLHKYTDLAVALGLLVVNAVLSFLQEQRASAAVATPRHQLQVSARVVRDGNWRVLPARELVAGDVVRVRTGDFVPADLQLLDGEVQIDQSALTGESQEQSKAANDLTYSGSVAASHWCRFLSDVYAGAHALMSARAAWRISSSVVETPTDRRNAPRARSFPMSIAANTPLTFSLPAWQAEPTEAAMSPSTDSRSSGPRTAGNDTLSVLGSR
jgi:magnesium-transporting ATPase (P-type)